jgi:RNA polymerase sigma-70 factor (ECF subfamily)
MMPAGDIFSLSQLIAEYDDELAFEKIFLYFYPKLLVFARSILRSKELAEEATEDVFLKLWQNRKTLPAIKNLNYYLFTAVKHSSLDYLARLKRDIFLSLDDLDIEFGDIRLNPEDHLISVEAVKKIQSAIDGLPARCKLIFRLVKEDGLKYREVAELLGLSVKTVETQMSLALSKVGQALRPGSSGNPLARSV